MSVRARQKSIRAMTKEERAVVKAALAHCSNLKCDRRLNWSTEKLEKRLHDACAQYAKSK
jgi:hypothetical protein